MAAMSASISMQCRRARVCADRGVGVADVIDCFETYMATEKCRDLSALLLEAQKTTTWKSSPSNSMQAIVGIAGLLTRLLTTVPNAMLPPKLTTRALVKMHLDKPCHQTQKDVESWADELSSVIRQVLAKLREMKSDPMSLNRAFKKAFLSNL